MKIIVTGASGFIGKNLLLKLPKDWGIFAFYNQSKNFLSFLQQYKLSHIKAIQCDLTNHESIQSFIKKEDSNFDACVYLAANGDPAVSDKRPLYDLSANAYSLVNFLKNLSFKKFIFFSSGAVYDGLAGDVSPENKLNPHLPYAISKLTSEFYIQHFAKKGNLGTYVILRFFGAYGPFEPQRKIYTKLVKTFYLEGKNEFIVRGNGKNLIDAMSVYDTIDAILKILNTSHKNITIDFCSGTPLSIDNLVQTAANVLSKRKVNIIHQGEVPEYIEFHASPNLMTKNFNFKPCISLEKGLLDLANFLKKSY